MPSNDYNVPPFAKPKFPFDNLIQPLFSECTPRILVYSDDLTYGETDYGLGEFLKAIKNCVIHGMNPIVTTASGYGGFIADIDDFIFSPSTLNVQSYDVVFLFGMISEGTLPGGETVSSLPTAEIAAITAFMDAGGGVFATGAFEDRGKFLSGNIPRIRGMRRWDGPSASLSDRLSTIDPADDNQFGYIDDTDAVPQKIYPAYYGTRTDSKPHYLLQHPTKKIIEVMPDHLRENECTLPDNLSDNSEWPLSKTGSVVSPQIIALSMSYGGGFPGMDPISEPRAFGTIAVYDGHKANVGRISTHSTYYHFIDYALHPIIYGEPGLISNPDAFDRVTTYFGNIARWLMPKKVRRCLRWLVIISTKNLYPVAEFIPKLISLPDDLEHKITVGREMQRTLAPFMTPAERQELVDDILALHSDALSGALATLRQEPTSFDEALSQRIFPVEMFEQAALGSAVLAAARALPSRCNLAECFKAVGGHKGLDKITTEILQETMIAKGKSMQVARKQFDHVSHQC